VTRKGSPKKHAQETFGEIVVAQITTIHPIREEAKCYNMDEILTTTTKEST
jgi:hypothetical protein